MPIYEFYSPRSRRIYSFYARSLSQAGRVPRCPDDPTFPMEKLLSTFSVTGRAKETSDTEGEGEDDPRMDQAMAEMEREFGQMDDANPDPRQLARMMSRMASLTGEKMPAQMQEMIARMEKGEDPEKLEEEYGSSLDDGAAGEEDAGSDSPGLAATLRRLRRQTIQRDPTLYEMADYLD